MKFSYIGEKYNPLHIRKDEDKLDIISLTLVKHRALRASYKYIKNESRQCIPADIPPETAQSIKNLALRAYNALDCSGLARVDFFLKKDGTVLLNEINTMPGFTEISMYSKMWEAEGMSFKSLITELINLAFSRKNETSRHT